MTGRSDTPRRATDTRLSCECCGAVVRGWFERFLEDGWPSCCGRTMRLSHVPEGYSMEQAVIELLGAAASPTATVLEAAA